MMKYRQLIVFNLQIPSFAKKKLRKVSAGENIDCAKKITAWNSFCDLCAKRFLCFPFSRSIQIFFYSLEIFLRILTDAISLSFKTAGQYSVFELKNEITKSWDRPLIKTFFLGKKQTFLLSMHDIEQLPPRDHFSYRKSTRI